MARRDAFEAPRTVRPPVAGPLPLVATPRGFALLADERALLREALVGLRRDDSALRAQLLVRLALAEAAADGGNNEPERLCRDAAAMARRLGDDELLASVLDAVRQVLWEPADIDRQLATAREILRHAQAAGVGELELQARQWLVRDHLARGDILAARCEMHRHAALADRVRAPRHLWLAAHWRAIRAHLAGRLDDAEALFRRARDIGRWVDPARAHVHFAAALFLVRRDQGRLAGLVDRAHRLRRRGRLPWVCRAGLALLYVEADLLADARTELAALAADGLHGAPHDPGRLAALCALADASASLHDVPVAAGLYESLSPYAGRNLVLGDAPIFQGSVSRHLGRLASVLGRAADAEAHLQRALAMHAKLQALPLQARTRLDLGTALLLRDHAGDRTRAAVHLGAARSLAGALGMHTVARRAATQLASLHPAAGDAAAAGGPQA